ncbi:MAG: DUF5615 family PIN-like protein [Chloroflexota bacterium]
MLKLYIDEDSMDRDLVRALRARGADVLTAIEADMIGRSDKDHLLFATSQDRVLYSFNRGDFFHIHTQLIAEGIGHAGIVLARQQHYSVGDQMRRLLKMMALRSTRRHARPR